MTATIIWNELVTDDQEACGKFYSDLFGWMRTEADAGPSGTYTLFQQEGKDVAGMMNPGTDLTKERGSCWYPYIEVSDAAATADRTRDLGGSVLAGPDDIPGVGRVCLLRDPTGGLFLVMQPAAPA